MPACKCPLVAATTLATLSRLHDGQRTSLPAQRLLMSVTRCRKRCSVRRCKSACWPRPIKTLSASEDSRPWRSAEEPSRLQVVWYKFRKSDFKQDGEQEVAEQAEKQQAETPDGDSQGPQEDGDVGVVEDSETAAHARSMLKVLCMGTRFTNMKKERVRGQGRLGWGANWSR